MIDYADPRNRSLNKAVLGFHRSHFFTANGTYELPFGPNRLLTKVANGVIYFPGIQQITDPSVANVSGLNGLNGSFTNKAISDAQGRLLLVNPIPGQVGSLGQKWIEGPPLLGFDMNLIKRVRIAETKEFEFRMDAINLLNHPNFGNPVVNINNVSFGRITTAAGNRRFVLNLRVNF